MNGSRTAGIRAAGFINTFSNCMLRANNDAIGLFLSTWPTEGSLWNNQVNVINCNLEWNRIGIVVANGDEVRLTGNNIEGCLGPAIMASGVWGLTISSNYMEDNNLKVPAYNIGGHYTTVIGDIILTGTGTTRNRPWMLPYTNDPASKDYSCTDAAINANECVVPILRYDLLGVSGAVISGNTFATGDTAINQLDYAAVVLAHADGVTITNNHMDKNGALILGPPGSSWTGMHGWNANYVSYAGNTAQGLGLQPPLRLLPTPNATAQPSVPATEGVAIEETQKSVMGDVDGASAAPTAKTCKYPGVGVTCQLPGYASFDSKETSHRNLARRHLDATKWPHVGNTKPNAPISVIEDINQPRSASDVYEWRSSAGAATRSSSSESGGTVATTASNVTVLAIQTEDDIAQTFPSLVGVPVYVAIQASPQQNGTTLYLNAGAGTDVSSVACPAGAKEWRLCIVTLDNVSGEGALSVSLTASVGAVWRLSDLVLAPIGAPLSSM